MKINHSPLPLVIRKTLDEIQIWSEQKDGGTTVSCCAAVINGNLGVGNNEDLMLNDAAFIVRCCNSHDALVSALWICAEHNALHFGEDHNTTQQARAALALAKGE